MDRQNQSRGIQLMLLGCFILPLMDATAKSMGETIASSLIVLSRFGFETLLLLPLVYRKLYWPRGAELRFHLIRALAMFAAATGFYTAIQVMPIADALAIFFVMPLLVTLLAPLVLGERIGWHRLSAVLVGLLGALIIIQPGHELYGWRTFLPLITALGFSFYLMYTRKLARSGRDGNVSPLLMQFYSGLFGVLITALAIILLQPLHMPVFEIAWPQAWQWRLLVLVGTLAVVGHLVIASAFRHAEASVLAPFQYTELVYSALLGWLIFGDVPMLTTWIGAAILVASGLYVFQRERLHRNAY